MNKKSVLLIVILILFLTAAGAAGYFYFKYQKSQEQIKNPNRAAQQETEALIEDMSKIIDLPKADIKNGEPTLATVLDKGKLKDQPFFANAENGDKVLIYTKAKKAFLYRPSTNKVINVAPVSIGAGQEVKVAVLNGTGTSDLANSISNTIKTAYSAATISSTANAAKDDYNNTIVVDVSGDNADAAAAIAQAVKGDVASLPAGETAPEGADIVVLVGADQQ
jgi:hypothetical protein